VTRHSSQQTLHDLEHMLPDQEQRMFLILVIWQWFSSEINAGLLPDYKNRMKSCMTTSFFHVFVLHLSCLGRDPDVFCGCLRTWVVMFSTPGSRNVRFNRPILVGENQTSRHLTLQRQPKFLCCLPKREGMVQIL